MFDETGSVALTSIALVVQGQMLNVVIFVPNFALSNSLLTISMELEEATHPRWQTFVYKKI